MRTLLRRYPAAKVERLGDLLAIAMAQAGTRRYARLGDIMEQRGKTAVAAVFRGLAKEAARREQDLSLWAKGIDPSVTLEGTAPALPPEFEEDWAEIEDSALLTPYRVLAIATQNAERAFAFFSYIAAQAADGDVAKHAERLARDQLEFAGRLRRKRRLAWHRERAAGQARQWRRPDDLADFRALAARLERAAAIQHRAIARQLDGIGAREAADVLRRLADEEAVAAELPDGGRAIVDDAFTAPRTPAQALRLASQPLEYAYEIFDEIAATASSEAVLAEAQQRLALAIERLAIIRGELGKQDG